MKAKKTGKTLQACAQEMAAISAESLSALPTREQERRLGAFRKEIDAISASRRSGTRASTGLSDRRQAFPAYARGRQ